MKDLLLLALFSLLCLPSFAEIDETFETSGNSFVRQCSAIDKETQTAAEAVNAAQCIAYVMGLDFGLRYERSYAEAVTGRKLREKYCIPGDVENGQLVRVVLKYIRSHPEDAQKPAPVLIIEALQKAYPCPR